MDAVATYELSKSYGETPALQRLNLQIPAGRSAACIGEKGSGKTTLIRILAGLSRPTSGECSVLGISPVFEKQKLHAAVGTVLGSAKLYEKMTLSENMLFFAGLSGVGENDAQERMSFLLHKLDIWEGRDILIDDLPTGVVRRASLARALMHSPRVLLIDEPSGGLNRESAEAVRDMISHIVSEEGVTALLCTENFPNAQFLCEEFAILKEGSLLAYGAMDELRQNAGVRFRAALRLGKGEPPRGFRMKDGLWQKEIDSPEEMPNIIFSTIGNGSSLYEAKVIEPTLEDIYAAWMAGGKRRAGDDHEQNGYYPEDEGAGEESVPFPADRIREQNGREPGEWQDAVSQLPGGPEE